MGRINVTYRIFVGLSGPNKPYELRARSCPNLELTNLADELCGFSIFVRRWEKSAESACLRSVRRK